MKSSFTFIYVLALIVTFSQTIFAQECDILILNDGTESSVIVSEIRVTEIAYKKCDFQSGPLYIVLKSDVFMIKYRNGQNELFKKEITKSNDKESSLPPTVIIQKSERKVDIKSNAFLESSKECVTFHRINGETRSGIILRVNGNNFSYKKCNEKERGIFTEWKKDLDFISNNEGTIIYQKN